MSLVDACLFLRITLLCLFARVRYAGGLFSAGTGLEANFLKEVTTSLFVAAEMALSCISQVGSEPGYTVSAAVNAIVLASTLFTFFI